MADRYELRFPALEIRQSDGTHALRVRRRRQAAPAVRGGVPVGRDDDAAITRLPAARGRLRTSPRSAHYLESGDPMIPNSIVIAFDDARPVRAGRRSSRRRVYSRPGTLVIPVDEKHADAEKPGWIVDGQQRTAAIREARHREFPICVTAFITDERGGAARAVHPRQLDEAAARRA